MNASKIQLRLLVLLLCCGAVPVLVTAAETTDHAPAAMQKENHHAGGKIVSFDAKTGVLVLRHGEKEVSVAVPETIAITKDGAAANRAVLVPGIHAVAVVHKVGGVLTAESVAVHTMKKPVAK